MARASIGLHQTWYLSRTTVTIPSSGTLGPLQRLGIMKGSKEPHEPKDPKNHGFWNTPDRNCRILMLYMLWDPYHGMESWPWPSGRSRPPSQGRPIAPSLAGPGPSGSRASVHGLMR